MGILSKFTKTAAVAATISIGSFGAASAASVVLDDSIRCGAGAAISGIAVTDVTGNAGGATECWGTLDGNDPGPSGDGFVMGSMTFDYLAKKDVGGELDDPSGIGLVVGGTPGTSGTWEFTGGALGSDFLIVLKAASKPGFAAWLFSGGDAASTMGSWLVAWDKDLSHLAVYKKRDGGGGGPDPIPLPASGLLLLAGFGGLSVMRRF